MTNQDKRICKTCKHDPPSKKWPCADCDMRDPADRWEPKDVPDINDGEMVSRQEAIDALDEIESEVADGYGFQYEKWRRYFCELPSVTPDRCDTCRFVYYPKETNNDQ